MSVAKRKRRVGAARPDTRRRAWVTDLVSVLIDGVIYFSYLFIIAVGLTLIYGVMKILNMAHGSLYALGAYVAATLVGAWFNAGLNPYGSLALLGLAALLVGVVAGPVI